MGDQDSGTGPSLELPSLGFGRKRRKKTPAEPVASDPDEPVAPEESTPHEPIPIVQPVAQPVEDPAEDPVTEPVEDPVDGDAAHGPADPPRGRRRGKQRLPRERRQLTFPAVPGPVAAVITGIVVGILAVLLTGLSLRVCEAVKGTPACGGPGFLLLIAILILLTYVGGWMLRAWHITDPLSTSFLAVGLMAVLAMLFLVDALFEWWMIIVIPVVAAGTYVLSWWVTASFVDVAE